jgi:hypothetical protein
MVQAVFILTAKKWTAQFAKEKLGASFSDKNAAPASSADFDNFDNSESSGLKANQGGISYLEEADRHYEGTY